MIDHDVVAGGILGLLVGDALGVPYEFSLPEALPPICEIEMSPPAGFRAAHGVPPGTWSDDGSQALCLAVTLAERGCFHAQDFANRIGNWASVGYLAVDWHVFDIGMQTQRALQNLASGSPPLQAGPSGEADNGNGSLMRVLPMALWHGARTAALVEDADAQSRVTHGHVRSRACCAMLCFIAWGMGSLSPSLGNVRRKPCWLTMLRILKNAANLSSFSTQRMPAAFAAQVTCSIRCGARAPACWTTRTTNWR